MGIIMKKTVAIAAIGAALATTPANAGGLAEPLMEPEVIEEQTAETGGFIIPLILLALIIAISSGGGGGGGGSTI